MTQTLQQALLRAGLITQDKLKKAENEKKAALRPSKPAQNSRPAKPSQNAAASTPKPQPSRTPERSFEKPRFDKQPRKEEAKKSLGFIEHKHIHHMRTECEACGKTAPDVEYYQHPNRSLSKYWLCLNCADNNNISDETRQTMQSQHAQTGVFRRRYGATKHFSGATTSR